jgi:signal transduction histidine kinase
MTARLHASFQGIREFSLHASHELRTPLTVMHVELETALRDNSLAPSERDRFASLLDEIQRLTQIVDGLTFLAKADAGVLKLASEPVQLDELVRDACADARILGESRKIQVHLKKCPPVTVTGDRHRLRQLLLILTDNAIKYNQEAGSVTLSLEAGNGSALLSIANTGPGIPSEIAGRVFDRFFRGDPSHSQTVEGCGLGLSIAQGIVQAHSGEIRFHSQPHGLTTATVALPAADQGARE